jgi:hypothetical protein
MTHGWRVMIAVERKHILAINITFVKKRKLLT